MQTDFDLSREQRPKENPNMTYFDRIELNASLFYLLVHVEKGAHDVSVKERGRSTSSRRRRLAEGGTTHNNIVSSLSFRYGTHLDNIHRRQSTVRDGTADTSSGGTLKVVHQIIGRLAAGGTVRCYKNKIIIRSTYVDGWM